jgi:diguanylate cyclase
VQGTPVVDGRSGPPRAAVGLTAVAVGAAFGALLLLLPSDRFATTVVDDLGQLAAPVLASLLAVRTARSATGPDRRLWLWLAAATASWAAGQAVWSWYELVLRVEPPFPSLADAGFLGFTLLAVVALLHWHGVHHLRAGARDLIDGGLLAGALLMLSWQTALGSVLAERGTDGIGFALAIAYPVGDLMSATVVLLLIARSQVASRPFVVLLAAGLLSLAVADSAYVYLVAQDGYATGNAISAGWVTGFLLIGAAAVAARDARTELVDRRLPARGLFALPYVAVTVALGSVVVPALRGQTLPVPEVVLGSVLVALVLVRQYLVLRDNEQLLATLQAREAALAHEVRHDGLTGLPNRAMLLERLDQLLALHGRDGRGLAVMFCDLDDFKRINDTYGHLAGDAVLREVAERLRACLRASDTVARLSGDEFAVLMEPPHEDPIRVAGRVIAALEAPVEASEGLIGTGVSVGIAVLLPVQDGQRGETGEPGWQVQARDLMAAADSAMYRAKSGGRNRAVLVEVDAAPRTSAAAPATA